MTVASWARFGRVADSDGDLFQCRRGLFKGGGLLFGALCQVVGSGTQFSRVAVDRIAGGSDLAQRVLQGRQRIVDVLLQFGEGAMERAVHVLRQVADSEAGDDAAGLVDAAIDTANQFVDAGSETIEIAIAIVLVDALGEIPGRGGGNDHCNARLQVGALYAQRGFLGVQFAHGKAIALEDFDGSRHFADFVLAIGKGHGGVEIALG